MNVAIALEQRFDRTPDGRVWTTGGFSSTFWERYLTVFDGVSVLARALDVDTVPVGAKPVACGPIQFRPLPYYRGPLQYATTARALATVLRSSVDPADALILRAPGRIATSLLASLGQTGRPYGMEIVGDPYDVFAPGAVSHPLRSFFRWWFTRRLRQQVAAASAVAYVTQGALQARYPAADDAVVTTHYSSIDLPAEVFAPESRTRAPRTPLHLVMVGSLEQLYKAPDVLLDALRRCLDAGIDARLTIVGDGRHRAELEARRNALGLGDRVAFVGQLPSGAAVREQLDRADLFVLPSRTEGLPRAMIEAMARGLPCIGSTAGGIPELLPVEDLVPPGDAQALATKIGEVASDPDRMVRMSARNLERARDYRDDVLRERRNRFYRVVRVQTEDWILSRRK